MSDPKTVKDSQGTSNNNSHLHEGKTGVSLPHAHAKMKLTDNVVRSFRVAKFFRENNDRINNINFSANGETVISSSDDDSIVIYDCQNGR